MFVDFYHLRVESSLKWCSIHTQTEFEIQWKKNGINAAEANKKKKKKKKKRESKRKEWALRVTANSIFVDFCALQRDFFFFFSAFTFYFMCPLYHPVFPFSVVDLIQICWNGSILDVKPSIDYYCFVFFFLWISWDFSISRAVNSQSFCLCICTFMIFGPKPTQRTKVKTNERLWKSGIKIDEANEWRETDREKEKK